MYNPVNMKIEDADRLKEKDIRDKNKKKRYEVRYNVEEVSRRDTLAEYDRLEDMALKRISHKHTEEEVDRGFNILTNGNLPTSLKIIKEDKQQYLKKPSQPWSMINTQPPASGHSQAPPKSSASAVKIDLTGTAFGDRVGRHTGFAQPVPRSSNSQAPKSSASNVP